MYGRYFLLVKIIIGDTTIIKKCVNGIVVLCIERYSSFIEIIKVFPDHVLAINTGSDCNQIEEITYAGHIAFTINRAYDDSVFSIIYKNMLVNIGKDRIEIYVSDSNLLSYDHRYNNSYNNKYLINNIQQNFKYAEKLMKRSLIINDSGYVFKNAYKNYQINTHYDPPIKKVYKDVNGLENITKQLSRKTERSRLAHYIDPPDCISISKSLNTEDNTTKKHSQEYWTFALIAFVLITIIGIVLAAYIFRGSNYSAGELHVGLNT